MNNRIEIPETRRLVLRVNDRKDCSRTLWEWLFSRGAVLLIARSTQHALELLGRARLDAVITDLRRMESDGINPVAGIELIQKLRHKGNEVPVIVYTKEITDDHRKAALAMGANAITTKREELLAWLKGLGI